MVNPLQDKGHPIQLIRFWNAVQRQYNDAGFSPIEFEPEADEGSHWRCHITDEAKGIFNFQKKASKRSTKPLNENLRKVFADSSFIPNQSFWDAMQKDVNLKGCFIPVDEFDRLTQDSFYQHLALLSLKTRYYPFVSLLKVIKGDLLSSKQPEFPMPVKALWHFFRYYVDFLNEAKAEDAIVFESAMKVFDEHYAIANFEECLPSEQLLDLLYLKVESFHQQKSKDKNIKKLLKRSIPPVQKFFKECDGWLNDFFEKGFGSEKEYLPSETEKKIKDAFYEICEVDQNLLQIQELLDDQAGDRFLESLPETFQDRFGWNRKKTLGGRLKNILGDATIMDRIQAVTDKNQAAEQPKFTPPQKALSNKEAQQWYQLSDADKSELLEAINTKLDENQKKILEKRIKGRWNQHLTNLLNEASAPFLLWEPEEYGLIPRWNLLDSKKAGALQKNFWEKRTKEKEELTELESLIRKLHSKKSMLEIKQFVSELGTFSFYEVQESWKQALEKYKTTVLNQSNYRVRRMREFGIIERDETLDYRKEIWLEEMLAIEEEVKPFILFVKKAFQAALPVRRSVEFDPYRHSHDGVEFDPETIQDQEKWMRANVMRTLKHKVDRGEVEQINAFALDSSGSMEHDRMRNLFKILYLLVLGLEDRKSYDAFHFFSTFFIETANFTNLYTNRKLLFKVIRKIATITNDKVLYGGNGGTNISDGVLNCHDRILAFAEDIRKKDPEANIVCSLFVITDGEPTMGILNLEELHDFVDTKRSEGDISIKGIYIKSEDDQSDFIPQIFGENNYVETTSFNEAVNKFVSIMTQTYKEQRKAFKWRSKQKKNNKPVAPKE